MILYNTVILQCERRIKRRNEVLFVIIAQYPSYKVIKYNEVSVKKTTKK